VVDAEVACARLIRVHEASNSFVLLLPSLVHHSDVGEHGVGFDAAASSMLLMACTSTFVYIVSGSRVDVGVLVACKGIGIPSVLAGQLLLVPVPSLFCSVEYCGLGPHPRGCCPGRRAIYRVGREGSCRCATLSACRSAGAAGVARRPSGSWVTETAACHASRFDSS
jgi:hypothetical protein